MERHVAKMLLEAALSLDKELGSLDTIVSSIADEATRVRFATALGNIMGCVDADFIMPITQEYLDLE